MCCSMMEDGLSNMKVVNILICFKWNILFCDF